MFSIFRKAAPEEVVRRNQWVPLHIAVRVETQVDGDDGIYSHGSSPLDTARTEQFSPLLPPQPSRTSLMALPRSNYDPRRVCLNPFPEFTLGKHRRTVGVYLAGALVSTGFRQPLPLCSNLLGSLRLRIGCLWTLRYYLRTLKLHMARRQTLKHPSTSPLSTGFQASAHYWDTLLSTSSTRTVFVETKDSETRERSGGRASSCLSALR